MIETSLRERLSVEAAKRNRPHILFIGHGGYGKASLLRDRLVWRKPKPVLPQDIRQMAPAWVDEFTTHLNTTNVILLVISPDFPASPYCYSVEMKQAMERLERGETYLLAPTASNRSFKVSSIHSPLTLATKCRQYQTNKFPLATLPGIAEQIWKKPKHLIIFVLQAITGFTRCLGRWDVGRHCASSGDWQSKQKRSNDSSGLCFSVSSWIRKSKWRNWRKLGCMYRT